MWSSASVHVLCMRSMRDHNPIYRRRHIHIHTQYTFLYVKPRERRIHFTRRTPYIYRSRTHYTIVSARKVSQNCTGLRFLLAPINRVNCHLIVFSLYLPSFSSYTNVRLNMCIYENGIAFTLLCCDFMLFHTGCVINSTWWFNFYRFP